MRNGIICALAVAAALISSGSYARLAPGAGASPAAPIVLHPLTPSVYWATDRSNVGVIIGRDGVVVIDATGSAARARELQAAIATVTPKPIKAVVLSHSDGDHVAGLAGFPAGIRIIAQTATKAFLDQAAVAGHPVAADRLPSEAFANRDDVTLAGVRMRLLHWGPAHTDGDLVVYLPDQHIVFAGDIFCMDQPRALIKPDRGGNSLGWIATARHVLALDADRILTGHGGVEDRQNLRRFVDVSVAERARIAALVARGETLPRIEAAVGEPQPAGTGDRFQAHFGQVVFQELTRR